MASNGNPSAADAHEIHVMRLNSHSSLAQGHGTEVLIDTDVVGWLGALNPPELLLTALAGCMIRTIERIAPGLGVSVRGIDILLTAGRRDKPPGLSAIRYDIRLSFSSNTHEVEKLNACVLHQGVVTSLLASILPITGQIRQSPA